ncbi:MAG: glycosyltransferase family 2 protein [Deltaproteobacteria bacterium]|nr:glycosyltransferase family 2 protein [Deltaproteobacteria bacterium]
MAEPAPIGVVMPTWNRATAAAAAVASVARLEAGGPVRTFVVDNGSRPAERDALATALAGRADVEMIALPENRGFAGAVNVGLAAAFARGAAAVLVLNDDAEVAADLLATLGAVVARDPRAGIVAPRVVDAASGREVSRGERVWLPLVCLPRTWLRVRGAGTAPVEVPSVLGVAFLVTRACFERIGGLEESFFAYYEEVDYCLRARAAGVRVVVAPATTVRHAGFRGFVGGFTPLAAYLKARNLPLLVRRHGGVFAWCLFAPTYAALLAASAVAYALRGEAVRVVPALARGVADGLRARGGPPPLLAAPAPGSA